MRVSNARLRVLGRLLLLAGFCVTASLPRFAAAGAGAGSITGTLTIGGKVGPEVLNAVVWVEGIPHDLIPKEKWKISEGAQMAQKNLAFVPHVLPVVVGTTVAFPNQDPVFHNVFSASPVHKFDLGLYPQGKSRSTEFDRPGIVQIGCNTHAQMSAYVVVLDEPYFTVANARGVYELTGVPLGSYTIKVWYPDLAPISQPFTLQRDGQVLTLDFNLGTRE